METTELSLEQQAEENKFYNQKRLAQNYAFEELIKENLFFEENIPDFIIKHGKELSHEVKSIIEDSNYEIDQEELNEKTLIVCREIAEKDRESF